MVYLQLELNADAESPLYSQIYQQIRDTILAGELPAGTRLPASRQLAQEYSLARITVTQAYDQLHTEGYVNRRRGAGTFVSESLPLRPLLNRTLPAPAPTLPELSQWGQRIAAQRSWETGAARRAGRHRFWLWPPPAADFPL